MIIKNLKTILRNLENISSNVTIQKNKWDEVEKLIVNCDNELQKVDDYLSKSWRYYNFRASSVILASHQDGSQTCESGASEADVLEIGHTGSLQLLGGQVRVI